MEAVGVFNPDAYCDCDNEMGESRAHRPTPTPKYLTSGDYRLLGREMPASPGMNVRGACSIRTRSDSGPSQRISPKFQRKKGAQISEIIAFLEHTQIALELAEAATSDSFRQIDEPSHCGVETTIGAE